MIRFTCLRTGRLLAQRAEGLSRAAALGLEEHLAECERCGAEARMLEGLRRVSDQGAEPLSIAARERAIWRALAATAPPRAVAPEREWAWPSAIGALTAALLVVVGVWMRSGELAPPPFASRDAIEVPTLSDRLVSGQLEVDAAAMLGGSRLPASGSLFSRTGAVVALAHALVELRPGTRVEWQAAGRRLELREGSLVADVDPARRTSFSLVTEHFRVIVLGTRFEVTPQRVRVFRGVVQVVAPDGRELARLSAGQGYDLPQPVPQTASPPTARGASRPVPAAAPRARNEVAASELLSEARVALAAGRVEHARALIARGLSLTSRTAERAEALSLRAECALVAGDPAAAVRGYLAVAQRFGNLPAGENAMFAAARIQLERGLRTQAEATYRRYLQRYPRGRFVAEANARLRELTTP